MKFTQYLRQRRALLCAAALFAALFCASFALYQLPVGAAAGLLTAAGLALAASTSRRMTRPCGPEPVMAAMSSPASLARRLASGDANTR